MYIICRMVISIGSWDYNFKLCGQRKCNPEDNIWAKTWRRKSKQPCRPLGKVFRQREYQVQGPGEERCLESLRRSTESSVSKEKMIKGNSWGPPYIGPSRTGLRALGVTLWEVESHHRVLSRKWYTTYSLKHHWVTYIEIRL